MPLNLNIKKALSGQKWMPITLVALGVVFFLTIGYSTYLYTQNVSLKMAVSKNTATIQEINRELNNIKSQDPYKTNAELKKQIDEIQKTFNQSVSVYESLLDLENPPKNLKNFGRQKRNSGSRLPCDASGRKDRLFLPPGAPDDLEHV